MKKTKIGAAVFATFVAGWCSAKAQTAIHLTGGRDWRAATSSERVFYVGGFMQGFAFGYRDGTAELLVHSPGKLAAMTPSARKETQEAALESPNLTQGLLSTKPSSLAATVSAFYEDDRNIPVCMDKAVILAALSLGGNPANDRDLAASRNKGTESGCQ